MSLGLKRKLLVDAGRAAAGDGRRLCDSRELVDLGLISWASPIVKLGVEWQQTLDGTVPEEQLVTLATT